MACSCTNVLHVSADAALSTLWNWTPLSRAAVSSGAWLLRLMRMARRGVGKRGNSHFGAIESLVSSSRVRSLITSRFGAALVASRLCPGARLMRLRLASPQLLCLAAAVARVSAHGWIQQVTFGAVTVPGWQSMCVAARAAAATDATSFSELILGRALSQFALIVPLLVIKGRVAMLVLGVSRAVRARISPRRRFCSP